MKRAIAALLFVSLVSSCGISPLGFLSGGGGGPTVNSNAQIGKENKQAVVTYEEETTTSAGRDVIQTEVIKEVEAGPVEKLQVSNQNIPPWVMVLLILGWLLPTPSQMGYALWNAVTFPFRQRKVHNERSTTETSS